MLSKAKAKLIQSLSRKKIRDQTGLFVAEGPKVVEELLRAPNIKVADVFALPEWLESEEQISHQLPLTEIDAADLKQVSALTTPNQVIGIFHKPVFPSGDATRDSLTLLLDTIQDPGNLGTIIRCADWFGIDRIICSPTCADAFSLKVVQATMGSIARVQIDYRDLLEFTASHADVPLYAADLDGVSVYDVKHVNNALLLIGNESRGIGRTLLERASSRVTIPRMGNTESLNAAVATGILLSHMVRPR